MRNIVFHPAEKRGTSDLGWLKSRFSFSFANYYNPVMMGFGTLRVINDDIIAGGKGFGKHPHQNMEIISIPTFGTISHSDSMGNHSIIKAGEVQIMSAGTGIIHSEMNHNHFEEVKIFQIWIETRQNNIEPQYAQKKFQEEYRTNKLQLLVSPDERNGSLKINQDAFISRVKLKKYKSITYTQYNEGSGIYIFSVEGKSLVIQKILNSRDALGITGSSEVKIESIDDSDLLILEVPI